MDSVEREFDFLIRRAEREGELTLLEKLREKLEEYVVLHKKNDR